MQIKTRMWAILAVAAVTIAGFAFDVDFDKIIILVTILAGMFGIAVAKPTGNTTGKTD